MGVRDIDISCIHPREHFVSLENRLHTKNFEGIVLPTILMHEDVSTIFAVVHIRNLFNVQFFLRKLPFSAKKQVVELHILKFQLNARLIVLTAWITTNC